MEYILRPARPSTQDRFPPRLEQSAITVGWQRLAERLAPLKLIVCVTGHYSARVRPLLPALIFIIDGARRLSDETAFCPEVMQPKPGWFMHHLELHTGRELDARFSSGFERRATKPKD